MSVLIKGMGMPKDCPQCPLSHWNKLDELTGCELVWRHVPKSEAAYWQSSTRLEKQDVRTAKAVCCACGAASKEFQESGDLFG